MQLKKAQRRQARLKIGISGPSGSGKTYSAIEMAKGMTDDETKIAVIDTENGSADLYSHLGDYNTLTLSAPFSPDRYIYAIDQCVNAGMEVIIIDSISHEWTGKGGCLEMHDLATDRSSSRNSYTAWREVTPKHQAFIDKVLQCPAHVIACGRTKDDVVLAENSQGKKEPKKVGLKTVTRDGFEYEVTLAFTIDRDTHTVKADKDRTGLFENREPFVITPDTGRELIAWAQSGAPPSRREELQNQVKAKIIGMPPSEIVGLGLHADMDEAELQAVLDKVS